MLASVATFLPVTSSRSGCWSSPPWCCTA